MGTVLTAKLVEEDENAEKTVLTNLPVGTNCLAFWLSGFLMLIASVIATPDLITE